MSANPISFFFGSILTLVLTLAWSLAAGLPAAGATDAAVTAINTLGVELLHQVGKPDANTLLSPYSIQSALAMAYAGSDGATRSEMGRALHYPSDATALDRSFAQLRESLKRLVQQSEEISRMWQESGRTNDPVALAVANRLFGQSGYQFREPFLALMKDTYAAPFEPLDFKTDPAAATRRINDWVEAQTARRIRNLITEGALDASSRLVLVNALYLKAPWAAPFENSATKPGSFYVNGGGPTDVPMMTQRHGFLYTETDGFSAVKLSLELNQLDFLIVLPRRRDGLASVERQLSADELAGKLKWEQRDVTLYLPRFKLEPPTMTLGKALQALGMKSAFDIPVGSANFDPIAPRRPGDYLSISEVFHKTFIDLNEKGVEAAAATAIAMLGGSARPEPPKPVEMRVDHPFVFAIVHVPSGACLFVGHVTDPR